MGACQDQKEKIILYTYNELDAKSGKEVEDHLKICEKCRNEQQRLLKLMEAIKDIVEVPELSPVEVKSLLTNIKGWEKRWWRHLDLRPSRFVPAAAMACLVVITVGIIGYMKFNAPAEVPMVSRYQNEIIINDRDLEMLSNLELLKEMDELQKLSQVFDLKDAIKPQGEKNNDTSGMMINGYREEYV